MTLYLWYSCNIQCYKVYMIFQNILCHKCHLSKNRKTWMRLRGRLVNLQLNKKYSDFTKVFYLYFQNSKSQRANKSNWKKRRLTFNRSDFSRRVTSATLGAFRRIYFVTIFQSILCMQIYHKFQRDIHLWNVRKMIILHYRKNSKRY